MVNGTDSTESRRQFLRTAGSFAAAVLAGKSIARQARASAISPATLAPLPELPDYAKLSATDKEMLDSIQRETLRYFTDFGDKFSGMARERTNGKSEKHYGRDIVTTGGTGFGVMAMLSGTDRGTGWPTHEQTLKQVTKIVNFLNSKVKKYHGVFPHFINGGADKPDGKEGKVYVGGWAPKEDGGDLVEHSFLLMGLLSAREYFSSKDDPREQALRDGINKIWEETDWKWYTKNGAEDKLYWHWSPTHDFAKNMPITGWNEGLVAHLLAASAPREEYRVSPKVYHEGWANSPDFKNNGTEVEEKGRPLFIDQYSLLGIDPHGLKDKHLKDSFKDYWEYGRQHALMNWKHCTDNPNKHAGYADDCWGLTSCDGPESRNRYQARCAECDDGTIAPTAALSSIDFLPEPSLAAARRFWRDKNLRGDYGLVDAFNLDPNCENGKPWYGRDGDMPIHLAIDQGPIVGMIENFRTGLPRKLFMNCPEIQAGLARLDIEHRYRPQESMLATSSQPQRTGGNASSSIVSTESDGVKNTAIAPENIRVSTGGQTPQR